MWRNQRNCILKHGSQGIIYTSLSRGYGHRLVPKIHWIGNMVCHLYLKNKYGDIETNPYLYSFGLTVLQMCGWSVCVCVCTHKYINTIYNLYIHTHIYAYHIWVYLYARKNIGQPRLMGEKQICFSLHNYLCLLNFVLLSVIT